LDGYLIPVKTIEMNKIYFEINHEWLVEKIEKIEKRFCYIYFYLLSTIQVTIIIVFGFNNLVIIRHYSNEKRDHNKKL
jgi:hypothetical protein